MLRAVGQLFKYDATSYMRVFRDHPSPAARAALLNK
jgi:hypothetical protein